MLQYRGKLAPFIRSLVGTTESIDFWEDPWMPSGRLIDQLGWSSMMQVGHLYAKVSEFIKDGRWVLPASSNSSVLLVWAEIIALDLPCEGTRDHMVWTPDSLGLFSAKLAYNYMRVQVIAPD